MTNLPKGLLIFIILMHVQLAQLVIDHAGKFDNYTCFRQAGYSQIIIRAFHSYGAIDTQAKNNIKLSNQAGLLTDIYMFPCVGKDPFKQSQQLISYLDSMKQSQNPFAYRTGTIWIDVETNPSPGCSWSQLSSIQSCLFLQNLVKELQKNGRSVGIYASHYMWNTIFGSTDTCKYFTNLPLWYAHYDQKKNFDDWPSNRFGGWNTPSIKQYTGDEHVCGLEVDLSFF